MTRLHHISFEQFDETLKVMKSHIKAIEQARKDVTALAKSLDETWTGAAASAFQDAQHAWTKDAADSITGLKRLETAAEATVQNYTNAAEANRRMWARE